jgi:TolB-like protein
MDAVEQDGRLQGRMGPLALSLLGEFSLTTSDGISIAISGKKSRALLAILALAPHQSVTRERLCTLLWGEHGDEQARNNLRQSLSVLRKELGSEHSAMLRSEDDRLVLDIASVSIDALELIAAANTGDLPRLRTAAAALRGSLLSDIGGLGEAFEDWLTLERQHIHTAAIRVLEWLTEAETGEARIDAAQRLVRLDRLRESSHRLLMRAHAEGGDNGSALRQFEECRKLLLSELGVEPSHETLELRNRILSHAAAPPASPDVEAKSASDKPSIALLPFTSRSKDPDQESLADGIVESIIMGLARFRDIYVISSSSTFAFKGRAVKIQDASRELGARYILEGSVQRSNGRLRITAQLVDGHTGRQLWAERYERATDDLFAVQDEVTGQIIGSLATSYGGRLLKAWHERPERTGTRSFQALDYFIRGVQSVDRFTKHDNLQGREFCKRAVELDPNFGKALAKLAWTYLIEAALGWSDDPDASLKRGQEFAQLAIERDDAEAWGYYALGAYYTYSKQFDQGIAAYQHGRDLCPNDADLLVDFAAALSYAGRSSEALEAALKGQRLNPFHPEWYSTILGQIYFDAGRYEEAIETLKSIRRLDTLYIRLYLMASHAALGQLSEAKESVRRAIELWPEASIQTAAGTEITPYKYPADLERFCEHLRKAGLPE